VKLDIGRTDRGWGAQGEKMLNGVNIARYNSGFSSPFPSFFIMSQFASLTDEERRDKMTMLRSIILFFYTRMPGFIIIFIHPHLNIPRSESWRRRTQQESDTFGEVGLNYLKVSTGTGWSSCFFKGNTI